LLVTFLSWAIRLSNTCGRQGYHSRPDGLWGPPSLLRNEYRLFPGVKSTGVRSWLPPSPSAEVKERVQLYPYSSLLALVVCYRIILRVYLLGLFSNIWDFPCFKALIISLNFRKFILHSSYKIWTHTVPSYTSFF